MLERYPLYAAAGQVPDDLSLRTPLLFCSL